MELGDSMNRVLKGYYFLAEELLASNKPINMLVAQDGIYEVRKTDIGLFSMKIASIPDKKLDPHLDKWKDGFIPTLPKIPVQLLLNTISTFKEKFPKEAFVSLIWDKTKEEYTIKFPEVVYADYYNIQTKRLNLADDETWVMDIHSHPTFEAKFSPIDDANEIETGLYGLVGKLHKDCPMVNLRASIAGNFLKIDLQDIFDIKTINMV